MSEQPQYLHGFTDVEQQRLLAQADFLAQWVYADLHFPEGPLLELGAGVGGQTRQLLRRTRGPITAVEFDARQLATLHRVLELEIARGRVAPLRADARALPLDGDQFASAFICWVLEHIPGPEAALREAFRALRPGGLLQVTEVQNQSFTLLPHDPELYRYWSLLNATQVGIGGDPYVGARLAALLQQAGYTDISIRFVPVLADAREPAKRAEILRYFHELLLSSVPSVVAVHGGSEGDWRSALDGAFQRAQSEPQSVFLYTFAQATARKPESP